MGKLNYCLIKGDPCTVYVVYPREVRLDPSVVGSEFFDEIKGILLSQGFMHVPQSPTFRSKLGVQIKARSLHAQLKKNGFERDKVLEENFEEQIDAIREFKKNYSGVKDILSAIRSSTEVPAFSNPAPINWGGFVHGTPTAVKHIKAPNKRKTKIISVGEKLDLHVYLFLRANPTPDHNVEFDFEFDLFSRENNQMRRFIKRIQCSFVRQRSGVRGVMYLESEKTLRDILKEMDFLYSIRLFHPKGTNTGNAPQPMVYNAIELKDYLQLDARMSLQVDIATHYDEMLTLSARIEKEKKQHEKNTQMPIVFIKKESNEVLDRMEQRMHYHSENENYELASTYQKNQNYVRNKLKILESYEEQGLKKLTAEQYDNGFTMKDLDF